MEVLEVNRLEMAEMVVFLIFPIRSTEYHRIALKRCDDGSPLLETYN